MSQVKIYKELDLTSAGCSGPIGELSSVAEELKSGEAVKVIVETVKSKMAPAAFLRALVG
jgi:TusA-related sulfurtransferase